MKILAIIGILLLMGSSSLPVKGITSIDSNPPSKFSLLSEVEKMEVLQALKEGKCEYKGIKLQGKVQFVDNFPDFTIRFVDVFEDIKVQFVDVFPNDCGKWQAVDVFPDFKVKVVDVFEDIKVKKVEVFPGISK